MLLSFGNFKAMQNIPARLEAQEYRRLFATIKSKNFRKKSKKKDMDSVLLELNAIDKYQQEKRALRGKNHANKYIAKAAKNSKKMRSTQKRF